MYGQHVFKKMLLAPMGCAVLLHNKPKARQTWMQRTLLMLQDIDQKYKKHKSNNKHPPKTNKNKANATPYAASRERHQ